MAFENRVTLKGSESQIPLGALVVGSVPDSEEVRVTLILNRKTQPGPAAATTAEVERLTRAEFQKTYGADSSTLSIVNEFAQAFQLKVVESDAAKRRVLLSGTAAAISRAFGTQLVVFLTPQTAS
jgi:kumamolisin